MRTTYIRESERVRRKGETELEEAEKWQIDGSRLGERDWEKGDCLISHPAPPDTFKFWKNKPRQMANTFIYCSQMPTSKFAYLWKKERKPQAKSQIPQITLKDKNLVKNT